jgi:hypothetical protein
VWERLVPQPFQPWAAMSSRLGRCKIVHMACSHAVMFTRWAELARKLVEAAYD